MFDEYLIFILFYETQIVCLRDKTYFGSGRNGINYGHQVFVDAFLQ